jgi:phosphoribosylanthranilate isomerase
LTALDGYRFFVAGGLNPENVSQAIAVFKPTGVDVSSGVESEGHKDLTKIEQFISSAQTKMS